MEFENFLREMDLCLGWPGARDPFSVWWPTGSLVQSWPHWQQRSVAMSPDSFPVSVFLLDHLYASSLAYHLPGLFLQFPSLLGSVFPPPLSLGNLLRNMSVDVDLRPQ